MIGQDRILHIDFNHHVESMTKPYASVGALHANAYFDKNGVRSLDARDILATGVDCTPSEISFHYLFNRDEILSGSNEYLFVASQDAYSSGFRFELQPNGCLDIVLQGVSHNNTSYYFEPNTDNSLVMTYDGTGVEVYINGLYQGKLTCSYTTTAIGYLVCASSRFSVVQCDVWSRVLTQHEIVELANRIAKDKSNV